ncbi:MAG: hypothetical protein NVSMB2_19940 [Chloroflexota bacterium]
MRLLIALGSLLCAGCVGPHSTGALWAQQNIQREIALSRVADAERAAQAQAYEQTTAERLLVVERARVSDLVGACSNSAQVSMQLSVGNRTRDTIRVLAHGDRTLQVNVIQVALADWFARRGQATLDAAHCDRAKQALQGVPGAADPTASANAHALLDALGSATVARDLAAPLSHGRRARTITDPAEAPTTTISAYALNFSDAVTAPSPLPQYLAAVYGGSLAGPTVAQPNLRGRTPESLVDEIAPAAPEWEPDAVYAAVSAR